MLHEKIQAYLSGIEVVVQDLKDAYVERYEEEILGNARVNLRLRIRFQSGAMLEVSEAVIVEEKTIHHLGFRYHFQDPSNELVFRYDNTPHFPDLSGYPEHKHTDEGVRGCERPALVSVIAVAANWDTQATSR